MAINFEELMETDLDTQERPPLLPQGVYVSQVLNYETFEGEKDGKEFGGFKFLIQHIEPFEDSVDPEELAAYGSLEESAPKDEVTVWLNKDKKNALYNVKQFMSETLGIVVEGRKTNEALEETPGCRLLSSVVHRIAQKSGRDYAAVDKTAPMP